MKTIWVEVIGPDGISYHTKQRVRSHRRKAVSLDRYLSIALTAMMWITAVLTLYGLWQIVRVL